MRGRIYGLVHAKAWRRLRRHHRHRRQGRHGRHAAQVASPVWAAQVVWAAWARGPTAPLASTRTTWLSGMTCLATVARTTGRSTATAAPYPDVERARLRGEDWVICSKPQEPNAPRCRRGDPQRSEGRTRCMLRSRRALRKRGWRQGRVLRLEHLAGEASAPKEESLSLLRRAS